MVNGKPHIIHFQLDMVVTSNNTDTAGYGRSNYGKRKNISTFCCPQPRISKPDFEPGKINLFFLLGTMNLDPPLVVCRNTFSLIILWLLIMFYDCNCLILECGKYSSLLISVSACSIRKHHLHSGFARRSCGQIKIGCGCVLCLWRDSLDMQWGCLVVGLIIL